jgi:hypothetical protein
MWLITSRFLRNSLAYSSHDLSAYRLLVSTAAACVISQASYQQFVTLYRLTWFSQNFDDGTQVKLKNRKLILINVLLKYLYCSMGLEHVQSYFADRETECR